MGVIKNIEVNDNRLSMGYSIAEGYYWLYSWINGTATHYQFSDRGEVEEEWEKLRKKIE